MSEWLNARIVTSIDTGYRITDEKVELPAGYSLFGSADIPGSPHLEPPAENIPVVAVEESLFRGQILGVLSGPDWRHLDELRVSIPQKRAPVSPTEKSEEIVFSTEPTRVSKRDPLTKIEGTYRTAKQLHGGRAPLWVQAIPTRGNVEIILPTQWPAHVARSVSASLRIPKTRIAVIPLAHGVLRDAATIFPSQIAVLAATAALKLGRKVLLGTTIQEAYLTGGRSATEISISTGINEKNEIKRFTEEMVCDGGAFPSFIEEAEIRFLSQVGRLYRSSTYSGKCTIKRSPTVPTQLFEGLHDSQRAFARETHINRLARFYHHDPLTWRKDHLLGNGTAAGRVCSESAAISDFHRHYSANETRSRIRPLPNPMGYSTRGIGFALASQQSGLISQKQLGAVHVTLEQDGAAVLKCSLPTSNRSLKRYWRSIVAEQLGIEENEVFIDDQYVDATGDTGPAIFSRGVSLVPRAIISACEAIRRRRFRDPLPIEVTRQIRIPKARKSEFDQGISYGGASVEAAFHPSTMEIDIRSVYLAVHAGKIMDRLSAEQELRRGVYQALGWTLHEAVDRIRNEAEMSESGLYDTRFRGQLPRIRFVFLTGDEKESSSGIGELPFSTIPAATIAALTQATGVEITDIPVSMSSVFRTLEER